MSIMYDATELSCYINNLCIGGNEANLPWHSGEKTQGWLVLGRPTLHQRYSTGEAYLIFVTGTTGGARGEKNCRVEKFVHITDCQVEKFST